VRVRWERERTSLDISDVAAAKDERRRLLVQLSELALEGKVQRAVARDVSSSTSTGTEPVEGFAARGKDMSALTSSYEWRRERTASHREPLGSCPYRGTAHRVSEHEILLSSAEENAHIVTAPDGDLVGGLRRVSDGEATSEAIDRIEVLLPTLAISIDTNFQGRWGDEPGKTCPCAFYPTQLDRSPRNRSLV